MNRRDFINGIGIGAIGTLGVSFANQWRNRDRDGDGVVNQNDDYPDDPNRHDKIDLRREMVVFNTIHKFEYTWIQTNFNFEFSFEELNEQPFNAQVFSIDSFESILQGMPAEPLFTVTGETSFSDQWYISEDMKDIGGIGIIFERAEPSEHLLRVDYELKRYR